DGAPPVQALKAHPNVGLNRLHQVSEVDVPVGIGQRARNQNPRRHDRARTLARNPQNRPRAALAATKSGDYVVEMNRIGAKLGSALALATLAGAGNARAADRDPDPWLGRDKALH